MQRWEYLTEEIGFASKTDPGKRLEQLAEVDRRLNARGDEGWELVSYGHIAPGGMTQQKAGYWDHVAVWKRPIEG